MKNEKKFVYLILFVILICTIILIFKELNKPKYDEKEYAKVYEELNEIVYMQNSNISNNINEDNGLNTVNDEIRKQKDNLKRTVAILKIDKIELFYPIISEMSMENLKIAPTKLCGPDANQIGNFCIVGHNLHNEDHFSRLKELEIGEELYLTDVRGNKLKYSIYDIYETNPNNTSCLSQNTNGKRELTLITCTNDSKRRLIIKCIEA